GRIMNLRASAASRAEIATGSGIFPLLSTANFWRPVMGPVVTRGTSSAPTSLNDPTVMTPSSTTDSSGSLEGMTLTANGTVPAGVVASLGGAKRKVTVCWPPGNNDTTGGSDCVHSCTSPIIMIVNCSTIVPVFARLRTAVVV